MKLVKFGQNWLESKPKSGFELVYSSLVERIGMLRVKPKFVTNFQPIFDSVDFLTSL